VEEAKLNLGYHIRLVPASAQLGCNFAVIPQRPGKLLLEKQLVSIYEYSRASTIKTNPPDAFENFPFDGCHGRAAPVPWKAAKDSRRIGHGRQP
jgi:hypothetical protein